MNLINNLLKRICDIVIATIVIIVFSPIMALMVIGIRLESKGPAIYKQERVGKNGRKFMAYKFRTMYQDSSIGNLSAPKKGDPRVTKVGYILRKTSLDELAQMFNVLNNTMSLIGPRAVPEKELELRLDKMISEQPENRQLFIEYMKKRQMVKPGISGMAQAYGRSSLSTIKATELDVYYVEHFSVFLDLKIFFKTLYTVIFQRGTN